MATARGRAPSARARRGSGTPTLALAWSPAGKLYLDSRIRSARRNGHRRELPPQVVSRIDEAFAAGTGPGLLHLGTVELETALPATLAFGREITRQYLGAARELAIPGDDGSHLPDELEASPKILEHLGKAAPPMRGTEYLSTEALVWAWEHLDAALRADLEASGDTLERWFERVAPVWNTVGRVYFHLAENPDNERAPFAFLATYVREMSTRSQVRHVPLGRALEEYSGDRDALLRLLRPVHLATEKSEVVKGLIDTAELFHPLAWTSEDAYRFLQDVPACESTGVVIRVPAWWEGKRPPRPKVTVRLDTPGPSRLGMDSLLQVDLKVTLGDAELDEDEVRELLEGIPGFRQIKGRWVHVDPEKLGHTLEHFEEVREAAKNGELEFAEGMRLLAGAQQDGDAGAGPDLEEERIWSTVDAGPWLGELLGDMQSPRGSDETDPGEELHGTLRPYQKDGVEWLWLLQRLGLGGCLADDMGLGKTIQVIALLLLLKRNKIKGPHLLVVPASLVGNWKAEIERFAPSLKVLVAHRSEMPRADLMDLPAPQTRRQDAVITTYGTLSRVPWFATRKWGLAVLDEAQAIKNPSARQSKAAKKLQTQTRLALTGTPVENRLSDLWSIYDFLNPGLLGSAASFKRFTQSLADKADEGDGASEGYGALRNLVRPYLLRRLKTDKAIIDDLPDKTEVRAYCGLTKVQTALYKQSVGELAATLEDELGDRDRRGAVLRFLMRFKQICNHPSQWTGDGEYDPADSGKMARLTELCEPISARQEKVLVFTQFREMTGPLHDLLEEVFGRPGLVLHGGTPVKKRTKLVEDFQHVAGPPFFVLSLKAGGTGLNLTAASHVIHFDRWWNPAVENQATDRAYRIGQKKNVLVHKFVCRGTVEERIDRLIADKVRLSEEVLSESGEAWLTDMDTDELLETVSLDLDRALADT